ARLCTNWLPFYVFFTCQTHHNQGEGIDIVQKTKEIRSKAKKCVEESIMLAKEEFSYLNIKPLAYNIKANIEFGKRKMIKALEYIDYGLASYNEEGEREDRYDMLKANKADYLQRLARFNEANEIINELLERVDEIPLKMVVAHVYELKAKSELRTQNYESAVINAEKGLRVTLQHDIMHRYFELRSVLGNIYLKIEKHDFAEKSYMSCLAVEHQLAPDQFGPMVEVYCSLGRLLLDTNRIEEGRFYFEQAVCKCKNNAYAYEQYAVALEGIGDYFYMKDKPQESISNLEQALKIYEKLESKKSEIKGVSLKLAISYTNIDKKMEMYYMRMYKDLANPYNHLSSH
ncbi:hypothetical protein IC620_16815, partial [Hazenella sp. IB182357]